MSQESAITGGNYGLEPLVSFVGSGVVPTSRRYRGRRFLYYAKMPYQMFTLVTL